MGRNSQQQNRRNQPAKRTSVGLRRRRVSGRGGRRIRPSSYHPSTPKGIRIPTRRELRFYTTPISKTNVPGTSWLDGLKAFGLCALKLFLTVVTRVHDGLATTKAYPTGATQCILIGIDDCLVNHPFVQWEAYGAGNYPWIPYGIAKVHQVSVTVRAGAKLSERAGRLAVALVEISRREASTLLTARRAATEWKTSDRYTYGEILQIPGARSFPMTSSVNLTWKPSTSSFAIEDLEIGQKEVTGADQTSNVLTGGLPFLRIVIGYSDFASDTGSVAELYGADEAEFSVSLSASVSLTYPARSYIRAVPIKSIATDSIGITTAESFGRDGADIPYNDVYMKDDGIYLRDGALERARLRAMEI